MVKNIKKTEKIRSKITGTDLNSIASTFAQTVATAENVTFGSAMLPDAGQEPLVVGKVFALNAGAATTPIVGNTGVYIAKLLSKTPASSEAGAFGSKMQLTQQARMQVNYKLMESLKKTNKVKDNRFTFF